MDGLSAFQLGWAALVFMAGFAIRNLAGFGAILLPALALFLPLAIVVPVVTLMAVLSSVGIAVRHRDEIAWRELRPLVPFSLIGVAIGLFLFAHLSDEVLVDALGVFVIAFGLYSLARGRRVEAPQRRWPRWVVVAPLSTFAAVVGTAFGGMAGPLYAVYLEWLRLDKGPFRATMSAILVALGTLRGLGYLSLGYFDRDTLLLSAMAVPSALAGMAIGARLHARATPEGFRRAVALVLVLAGVGLLLR